MVSANLSPAVDQTSKSIVAIAVAVVVGTLVSWAGSDGSAMVGDFPVFAICGALAFVINWIAFVPANAAKTERFYDLTGSITYLSVTAVAVLLAQDLDARAVIAAVMVAVWALRLGTFLYQRIKKAGKDGRFDEIKTNSVRFLMSWTVQGLWVLLTAAAVLAIITGQERAELGWLAFVGIAVWILGFGIEVIADLQKSSFKQDPENDGRFISTGLWAWSRHPNYFGEITLWTGMALLAVEVMSGWQWIVLISPIFVTVLLTKISGIPPLERRADERWRDEPDYQEYKATTPVLIPKPPTG